MVGNNSAVDNFANDIGVVNSQCFQLDISVIDKYSSAYRNVLWKLWECDRADSFITLHFSYGKCECIAVLDSNRLVILKVFKSYLRSFCIKKSCNINAKFFP